MKFSFYVFSFLGISTAVASLVSVPEADKPSGSNQFDAKHFDAKHFDEVQRADYCAKCHPAEVDEHKLNTHGRAFSDEEVRLATGRFSLGTCIACHTPRPVFETGIGMNPQKRLHNLEEGNSCLTCHQRGGYDISKFVGGAADCKAAFDPRVGTVESCASCHKNHGTPYQWENAVNGKLAERQCVDCHMPFVVRPPAVGVEARKVRRHTFFAGHSETQIRKAYLYDSKIEGNEVVVKVTNHGAGHNFPTELKQRSVESLVVIKDLDGKEIARSRRVFRDPYKRPYGLNLPVNTQIPSGETREHRVPIAIPNGIVETTLFYKLYYPIEDEHPSFSSRLESRTLAFSQITPSTKPLDTDPEIHAALPEVIPAEAASPANLADFPHPKIGKVEVDIPDGTHPGDIEKLVSLFQFPVLEANRKAVDVLVSLKEKAVPALIDGLGSWDNKTFGQSQGALVRIGDAAKPKVLEAINDPRLYVRIHVREILPKMNLKEAEPLLRKWLSAEHPLDRKGAALALKDVGSPESAGEIRKLLNDHDPDVVAAAALALAKLKVTDAIPEISAALEFWPMVETKRDLALSLAILGEPKGASVLLSLLDYPDDLLRESFFEAFYAVTGKHEGYFPQMEHVERLAAIGRLRAWWEKDGGKAGLRHPPAMAPFPLRGEIENLVSVIGGNDFIPDDPEKSKKALARLIEIGKPSVPSVIAGFKWPPGFSTKRAMLCQVLIAVPDANAVPTLLGVLEDPVVAVALWGMEALEQIGDPLALPALRKFEARIESLGMSGKLPASVGSADFRRAQVARVRWKLGDKKALDTLFRLYWTGDSVGKAEAELNLKKIVEDSSDSELIKEINAQFDRRDVVKTSQIDAIHAEWEKAFEEANRLAQDANTNQQMLNALASYDKAEAVLGKMSSVDAIQYSRTLKTQIAAANDVIEKLYQQPDYENSVAWQDITSEESRQKFVGASLMDYVLDFEFTFTKGSFELYHRYDPNLRYGHRVVFNKAEDGAIALVEGKRYHAVFRVIGDRFYQQFDEADAKDPQPSQTRIPWTFRQGGVFFFLNPDSKVNFEKIRIKILR